MLQRHDRNIGGVPVTVLVANRGSNTLLYFIPGNPGAIDLYREFLTFVASETAVDIVAISHAGHTEAAVSQDYSLEQQMQHHRNCLQEYSQDYGEIILVGHSVGAYIATQLEATKHVLLFPTLQHIAQTPNGLRLSELFQPKVRFAVSMVAMVLAWLPSMVLTLLVSKLAKMDQPDAQIVARTVVKRHFASNALYMAATEMQDIQQLEVDRLNKLDFVAYFGKTDGWAPVSHYKNMALLYPKVYMCALGMSHAFILDADRGEAMAKLIKQWI